MVTLSKTWHIDTNVIPSDQTTAANQYARIVTNLKRFLVGAATYEDGVRVPDGNGAAGVWTVARSSNGTTASAADNWAAVADIVRNTEGNVHSWIVFRSPISVGFLPSTQFVEILINCDTAATELVSVSFAVGSNPFAGGTTTNAPTLPTNGVSIGNIQIVENTPTLAPHRQHFWRSEEGDIFCTISRDGSGAFGSILLAWQGEGGDAADVWPCTLNAISQAALSANVITFTNLSSSSNLGGWSTDNTQHDASPAILSTSSTIATTGFGAAGGIPGRNPALPIDLFQEDANIGLYHGRVPDIRFGSPNQANLTLEATADAMKRLNVGHLVLFKLDADTLPVL